MRLAIVSDAWRPQVNGVVTTLTRTVDILRGRGHEILTITPDQFRTIPCPTYKEIRLALLPGSDISDRLQDFAPEAIHICTEGPLGLSARRYCLKHGLPFTTSLHTRFPEYVKMRLGTPLWMGYRFLRWFHGPAQRTMVATPRLRDEFEEKGLDDMVIWSRGVDTEQFCPAAAQHVDMDWQAPVFTYMGRVAVEKNIEAFLKLDLPGTKVVIGDGPAFTELKSKYPGTIFTGCKRGDELAGLLAASDCFVFPSLTDTFGLVMIEAMACGLPVAAFPVRGPLDVLKDGVTGVMDHDLRKAALAALELDPAECRLHARSYSWDNCTDQFYNNLWVDEEMNVAAS